MIGRVFVGNDYYKFEAKLLEFTPGKVINGYEAVIGQDCIPVLIKDRIAIGWFFMAVLLSVHDDLKVAEFGLILLTKLQQQYMNSRLCVISYPVCCQFQIVARGEIIVTM